MSIYTIATTNSLKSSVPELANAAAGDVIKTSGYYAANDGGAGTFDIRARAAGDTVDNTRNPRTCILRLRVGRYVVIL